MRESRSFSVVSDFGRLYGVSSNPYSSNFSTNTPDRSKYFKLFNLKSECQYEHNQALVTTFGELCGCVCGIKIYQIKHSNILVISSGIANAITFTIKDYPYQDSSVSQTKMNLGNTRSVRRLKSDIKSFSLAKISACEPKAIEVSKVK